MNPSKSQDAQAIAEIPRQRRTAGFFADDEALTRALQAGHPGAPAELFDRYGSHIQGVLVNVMGIDQELPDLLHESFAFWFIAVGMGSQLKTIFA